MSYDLMVFVPSAAPKDREGFLSWYSGILRWDEDHGYDNPAVCAAPLGAWFHDLRGSFPALNGPFGLTDEASPDDFDNPRLTDYSIGRHAIYAAFRWSQMRPARSAVFSLAKRHRLGFFDVSADDGQVWLPSFLGGYRRAHGSGSTETMPNPLG